MKPDLRVRAVLSLLILIALAVALTVWVSGAAIGQAALDSPLFQSPPAGVTPKPTLTRAATAVGTAVRTPVPTLASPTITGTVAMSTETPTASRPSPAASAAPGYLPPPTLTTLGTPVPLLPGPAAPLVAPPAPIPARPEATAVPQDSLPGIAQLIDLGILGLSYLWLCCGAGVLFLAVAVLVWLARHGRPS